MMVATEYVFGIDVSKRKLDTVLIHEGKLKSKVFDNTPSGHRTMLNWLEAHGAKAESSQSAWKRRGHTVSRSRLLLRRRAGKLASSIRRGSKGLPKAN